MPHIELKFTIKGKNLPLVHKVLAKMFEAEFGDDYYDCIWYKGSQIQFNSDVPEDNGEYFIKVLDFALILKKMFPDLYIYAKSVESYTGIIVVRTTSKEKNYFIEKIYDENSRTERYIDLNGDEILNLQLFLRKKKLQKLRKTSVKPKKYSDEVIWKFIEKYLTSIPLKMKLLDLKDDLLFSPNNKSNDIIIQIEAAIFMLNAYYAQCDKILLNGR